MEGTHVGGVLRLVHLIHVRLVDVGRDGLRGHPIVLRLVHVHHVRGLGEAGGLAAVRDRRRGIGGWHATLLLLLLLAAVAATRAVVPGRSRLRSAHRERVEGV